MVCSQFAMASETWIAEISRREPRADYCVSNTPFQMKWETDQAPMAREHQEKGIEGRIGPKLPRVSDGPMLFLFHLLSKLELPERGGGRPAIVLSGSPTPSARPRTLPASTRLRRRWPFPANSLSITHRLCRATC